MRDVKILGNHQDLYFLQVSCSSCHSRFLITAVINDKSSDIISDLTNVEFTKFKNASAPNANDVLDMHSYLKEFGGDFCRIFGYKKV